MSDLSQLPYFCQDIEGITQQDKEYSMSVSIPVSLYWDLHKAVAGDDERINALVVNGIERILEMLGCR